MPENNAHAGKHANQFQKDTKRCQRRGKDLEKFKMLARTLLDGQRPDAIHRDHKLSGNLIDRRDCHIESDWVLVYRIEGGRLVFERMGTHSDLFKFFCQPALSGLSGTWF